MVIEINSNNAITLKVVTFKLFLNRIKGIVIIKETKYVRDKVNNVPESSIKNKIPMIIFILIDVLQNKKNEADKTARILKKPPAGIWCKKNPNNLPSEKGCTGKG
jgi:hypothetical protein